MYTFLLLWSFDFERGKGSRFWSTKNITNFQKILKIHHTGELQITTFFLTHPVCMVFFCIEQILRNQNTSLFKYFWIQWFLERVMQNCKNKTRLISKLLFTWLYYRAYLYFTNSLTRIKNLKWTFFKIIFKKKCLPYYIFLIDIL